MTIDISRERWVETYKSLISISTEGFKFSALANGGAAVAILAYLGNVAVKSAPVPAMKCPMAAFLSGLVLVGFAMVCAYFTQLKLLIEIERNGTLRLPHGWLLRLAAFLYVGSLIAFACGSWQAVVRFG